MAVGPWSTKFVGAHVYLDEPGIQDGSWDNIPSSWTEIRFDAVDVLFISPFFVNDETHSIMLSTGPDDGGSLLERFHWVIRAARSTNPNIKIIMEQFMGNCPGGSDWGILQDRDGNIDPHAVQQYADSVASFIDSYYNRKLPALDGVGQVSARLDGLDVDVEKGNDAPGLPKILTAVRKSLDALSQKLSARFTLSICPAWTSNLDASVAQSCDYVNMQNYDGGQGTSPDDYLRAVPGLQEQQLVWGFTSEMPWVNAMNPFEEVEAKVEEVVSGRVVGAWAWRLNSDNYPYENVFQVWLYNTIHGVSLPNAKPERVVAKYWPFGGREGGETGPVISTQNLN
ncbi:hypothetical protein G7Z17_g4369 [Cylindrodendrum hubeiense]|uniref:GH18 domain-containing protein n=1 Tax=Cylindrodendrum hubeiense TaxID=595255 RepID=A0A9P5LH85_9HYPO|nr:hypothetical protein G7Z17_g4369 [Cylindrodendrum hubeiense]